MSSHFQDDRLLTTPLARRLFHEVARDLPIIDYHSHLDPRTLAENRRFHNLAELWINTDPYKHRAMRIAGVPESEITGNAADRVKFDRWAETVPLTLGNPVHSWSALELKRYFGLDEPLSPATADAVWTSALSQLQDAAHTTRGFLERSNVECVCTSDRLLDDLSPHAALACGGWKVRVLPSLRADDITAVETPGYSDWIARLEPAVRDYDSFRCAVRLRLDAFQALGCRLADHALDDFRDVPASDNEAAALFAKRIAGSALDPVEKTRLRSGILRFLGTEYARRGWILQLHLGAQRRTSTRLRRLAGPAGGYASIGNPVDIPSLCGFLDGLEQAGSLPRTILYPLNPADSAAIATLTGSFAADGIRGLVQFGPAWWFNDHAAGIRTHLETLSAHGLLAAFIGMTTDSRSLLSMVRHEYFRRVLCNWIGEQAARGIFPDTFNELAPLVCAVCHGNAAQALGLATSSF